MSGYSVRKVNELGDDDRFEPATKTGRKIRCTVCHAQGHPGGAWMERHRGEHKLCPLGCGKMLATRKGGNVWHQCP